MKKGATKKLTTWHMPRPSTLVEKKCEKRSPIIMQLMPSHKQTVTIQYIGINFSKVTPEE
jgi:hypothetical protein